MGIENAGTFAIGGDMAVHRLGFGAMQLTGPFAWGEPKDPEASLAVLRRAVALGVDFIDTAEGYGPRINERQIRDALAPYPTGLVIATKCGLDRRKADPLEKGAIGRKGSRDAIRDSLESSLALLGVDRIDLFQLHGVDPQVPLAESMAALAELRDEGKVRHIGLSNVTVEQIETASAIAPVASVQNIYNLQERKFDAVLNHCEANGIAFLPWYPLGGGGLCAADGPLAGIAARHGAKPSQVALAWLLARSPVLVPIPGTASIAHLEDNVGAADVSLTPADMVELDAIGAATVMR